MYVGKTEKCIPTQRFSQHLSDANRFSDRALYRAINKYGKDAFIFTVIEETDNPEEREVYWINTLNTYGSTGYNCTLGGEGKKSLNEKQIIEDYKHLLNMKLTADKNNCSFHGVKEILKRNNVTVLTTSQVSIKEKSNRVCMICKSTEQVLETFESQSEAARHLILYSYSKATSIPSVANKISLVCRNVRKTAFGFIWKLI